MTLNNIITDYNNWTYSLPLLPQLKDYNKLADKLKTYVTSSKFVTEGDTIDEYDPQTGKRIKRPIYDVVYRLNPMSEGISSDELKKKIYKAILSKDKKKLLLASKYRFYSARKNATPSLIALAQKLMLRLKERAKRRRTILTATILGGAGASLGLIPFIYAKKQGTGFDLLLFKRSVKMGLAGAGIGLLTTGIVESVRS